MADAINVVSLIKIKPEHIKDAEPLVKELAEFSRKEPGVNRYEIFRVKEKEGVYVFMSQYKTQEDFDNHKKSEIFQKTIAATSPYFVEPPTIVSLEKEQIWFIRNISKNLSYQIFKKRREKSKIIRIPLLSRCLIL